jgi:hypothetical protein
MVLLVPGMDNQFNREDYVLKHENDTLSVAWRQIESNLKQQTDTNTLTEENTLQSHVPIIKNNQSTASSSPSHDVPSSSKKTKSKLSLIKKSLFQSNSQSNNSQNESKTNQNSVDIPDHNNNNNQIGSSNFDRTSPNNSGGAPLLNVVKLVNKTPDWHAELKSFALDFNGRVTESSSKNFQIIHEANKSYVVLQFGKVNKDLFTCDFSYPFCALQAFGMALSSLEDKLACD